MQERVYTSDTNPLTFKCDLDLGSRDLVLARDTSSHNGDHFCQVMWQSFKAGQNYAPDTNPNTPTDRTPPSAPSPLPCTSPAPLPRPPTPPHHTHTHSTHSTPIIDGRGIKITELCYEKERYLTEKIRGMTLGAFSLAIQPTGFTVHKYQKKQISIKKRGDVPDKNASKLLFVCLFHI